jgi:hypothetical protein
MHWQPRVVYATRSGGGFWYGLALFALVALGSVAAIGAIDMTYGLGFITWLKGESEPVITTAPASDDQGLYGILSGTIQPGDQIIIQRPSGEVATAVVPTQAPATIQPGQTIWPTRSSPPGGPGPIVIVAPTSGPQPTATTHFVINSPTLPPIPTMPPTLTPWTLPPMVTATPPAPSAASVATVPASLDYDENPPPPEQTARACMVNLFTDTPGSCEP